MKASLAGAGRKQLYTWPRRLHAGSWSGLGMGRLASCGLDSALEQVEIFAKALQRGWDHLAAGSLGLRTRQKASDGVACSHLPPPIQNFPKIRPCS